MSEAKTAEEWGRSPLTEALKYYELNEKCPACGIVILLPKITEMKTPNYYMECPKCHQMLKIEIHPDDSYNIKAQELGFNPSRR